MGHHQHGKASSLWHPRYWLTWLGLLLWRLLRALPLRLLWQLGGGLGMILYALLHARRRVAIRNIERCFPDRSESDRRTLVRRHFRAVGRAIFDTGVAAWSSSDRLRQLVRVEGLDRLQSARAAGQPIILLAPHFVLLPICALYMAELEPVIAMYKRLKNQVLHEGYRRVCTGEPTSSRLLDWILGKRRGAFDLQLVEHRQGLRPIVHALRAGMLFYYLPDQDLGRRHSEFVPFFGIPAATVTAVSGFARLSKAAVILCWASQKPLGAGYELNFSEPLGGFPSQSEAEDALRINRCIENIVADIPDQYFWLHKRFKTRPPGEAAFYE